MCREVHGPPGSEWLASPSRLDPSSATCTSSWGNAEQSRLRLNLLRPANRIFPPQVRPMTIGSSSATSSTSIRYGSSGASAAHSSVSGNVSRQRSTCCRRKAWTTSGRQGRQGSRVGSGASNVGSCGRSWHSTRTSWGLGFGSRAQAQAQIWDRPQKVRNANGLDVQ